MIQMGVLLPGVSAQPVPAQVLTSDSSERWLVFEILEQADLDPEYLFTQWGEPASGPAVDNLSEGYRRPVLWLRLALVNPETQVQERWLTFTNPLLDRITVEQRDADGQRRTYRTGEHWRGEAGSEPVILSSVRLALAPGETRVLIRVETEAAMATRVALLYRASFQRVLDLHALKAAVVVACQLVAAIAALIVAVLMRSRLWRAFAIFAVGNGVVFAHLFGYLSWWFDAGGSDWPDRLGAIAFAVALVAGVEFTARAIGLYATRPVLFTRSMMDLIVLALCALLAVSLGWTALSIEALLGLALIASAVMLYALTARTLHRRKVGPFLTAGIVLHLGFLWPVSFAIWVICPAFGGPRRCTNSPRLSTSR